MSAHKLLMPIALFFITTTVIFSPAAFAQDATPTPAPAPVCAANLPPVISARIYPRRVIYLGGLPGASASLTIEANATRDPEGQNLEFAFDADGDGSFTPFFISTAGSENVTMPGPFLAAMKARDAGGAAVTEYFQMVARQFQRQSTGLWVWGPPAMTMVAGRPALMGTDGDSTLVFAINSQADGSGAWTISPVDPTSTMEKAALCPCTLDGTTGRPLVVYTDASEPRSVRFGMSTRADGSGKWHTEQVVAVADEAAPTLGVFAGKPVVLYYQDEALTLLRRNPESPAEPKPFLGGLLGLFSSQPEGAKWDLLWSWDVGNTGPDMHSALIQVGDPPRLPALAYYDAPRAQLAYAVNQKPDGTGKWDVVTIDSNVGAVGAPSLAMLDGRPGIAYRASSRGELRVAMATNSDGRGTWKIIPIDARTTGDGVTTAGWPLTQSLALIDGRPAVAYEHATRGLVFSYHPGQDIGAYWPSVTVDMPALQAGGMYPALALADGRPAIAYTSDWGIQFASAR